MVKDLELNFKGKKVVGKARFPKEEGSFKTIIMFHDLGLDKDGSFKSFEKLENNLIEKDIAVIRFDFLGHGKSEGRPEEVTTTSLVEQGKSIVRLVKEIKLVDSEEVSILGEGFGAIVGSIVVSDLKNEIKHLSMVKPELDLIDEVQVRKLIKGVHIYKFYKQEKINIDNFMFGLDFVKDLEVYPYFDKLNNLNNKISIIEENSKSYEFVNSIIGEDKKENLSLLKLEDSNYNFYEILLNSVI